MEVPVRRVLFVTRALPLPVGGLKGCRVQRGRRWEESGGDGGRWGKVGNAALCTLPLFVQRAGLSSVI
jgi:hypothetical protein